MTNICSKCGHQNDGAKKFCSKCGTGVMANQVMPSAINQNASSTAASAIMPTYQSTASKSNPPLRSPIFGELLMFGTGAQYLRKTRIFSIILTLIICGVLIGAGVGWAEAFEVRTITGHSPGFRSTFTGEWVPGRRYTRRVPTSSYPFPIATGFAISLLFAGWQIIKRKNIGQTYIYVYEHGIEGLGVGPGYGRSWADTTTKSPFNLYFKDIGDVKLHKSGLLSISTILHNYVVAAPNAADIIKKLSLARHGQ